VRSLAFATLLLALGCSGGEAVELSSDVPSDIKVVGKVGDTYRYTMSSTIRAIGAKGHINLAGDITEELTSVEDGTFAWETTFSNVDVEASGVMADAQKAFSSLDGLVMTSVQDERGTVKALRASGVELPNRGSSNVVLPPKGTKAGGTWPAKIDVGGHLLEITYKLEGAGKFQGFDAVRITGSFPESSGAELVEPTEFWVESKTGKMIRGSAKTRVTADAKVVEVEYTIERVKD
jgi:hypothetical protein